MSEVERSPEPRALEREIGRICPKFGVAELYVFGSRTNEVAARVRGKTIAGDKSLTASDVDIGVRPLPGRFLDVDSLVALADELERRLDVPREIGRAHV